LIRCHLCILYKAVTLWVLVVVKLKIKSWQ
jgi:hypothetical protein